MNTQPDCTQSIMSIKQVTNSMIVNNSNEEIQEEHHILCSDAASSHNVYKDINVESLFSMFTSDIIHEESFS